MYVYKCVCARRHVSCTIKQYEDLILWHFSSLLTTFHNCYFVFQHSLCAPCASTQPQGNGPQGTQACLQVSRDESLNIVACLCETVWWAGTSTYPKSKLFFQTQRKVCTSRCASLPTYWWCPPLSHQRRPCYIPREVPWVTCLTLNCRLPVNLCWSTAAFYEYWEIKPPTTVVVN